MASGGWAWFWTVISFLLGQAVILGGQLLGSRAQSRREAEAREAEVRKAKQDRRDAFELSHLPDLHVALSDWISIAEPTLRIWCRWHRLRRESPTRRRRQAAIDEAIAAVESEARELENQWNECVERVRRLDGLILDDKLRGTVHSACLRATNLAHSLTEDGPEDVEPRIPDATQILIHARNQVADSIRAVYRSS